MNNNDLQLLKSNSQKTRKNTFFSLSEKHLVDKKWPECDCMTCASNYEDQLAKNALEKMDEEEYGY